jgi:hypothetical protein
MTGEQGTWWAKIGIDCGREIRKVGSWAHVDLNHGPLPCEGSALPLSHAPVD